jgi:hypothetical protein
LKPQPSGLLLSSSGWIAVLVGKGKLAAQAGMVAKLQTGEDRQLIENAIKWIREPTNG